MIQKVVCCFLISFFLYAKDFDVLEKKIYEVITKVEKSNLVFIRNKTRHSSAEAAAHIKRKFEFAKMSPFTPSKSKWTMDFFVKEIASKSSTTNEPYYLINESGVEVTMEEWLQKSLIISK